MYPPWPGSNILHLPRQGYIDPTLLTWEPEIAKTGTVWLVGRDKGGCDITRFPATVTNLNYEMCAQLKRWATRQDLAVQAVTGMKLWQYRLYNDRHLTPTT